MDWKERVKKRIEAFDSYIDEIAKQLKAGGEYEM